MTVSYGKRIAEAGLKSGAIRLNVETPFLWASGYYMPIYNDNRMLLVSAEYRKLIAQGFISIMDRYGIRPNFIAGTSTAGIPHATTLADSLGAPLTYVRDKPKGYGLRNRIEGLAAERGYGGKKVVLIEDLVSTGGSSIGAVEAVREAGGDISFCLAIFDYGFSEARERFEGMTPPCRAVSILTYDGLMETALESGFIDVGQAEELAAWREDPFGWGSRRGFERQRTAARGG